MLFVKIYRFFQKHKGILYTLLVLSTAVFVYFGLKVRFEEDFTKLLPSSEKMESGLVFGNLKVKDKVFLQMTGEEPEVLAGYVDELMDSILTADEYIANTLYRMDLETGLNAMDFAMEHVPSFVDTTLYARFDEAIAHADETMAANKDLLENDESGNLTQMVTTDPLNFRQYLMPDISGGTGFSIVNEHLFSADSTVALMFISPNFKSFDTEAGTIFAAHLQRQRDAFQKSHPGVKVMMHGAVIRSIGNSHMLKRDIGITIGISLLIILIVLCVSFKSINTLWQNVLPVAYGTFFALACMYWIKGGMSLMAMGIGSVVLGVAISYCLHVIIHQRFVGDVEQMLSEEAKPVFLGCLTTIGAFLGLMFTQSELLKDFGLFATFALIGNTFFALVFLPHFLKKKEDHYNKLIIKFVDGVNNYAYDRNPICVGVLAIIILVGFIFTPKVQFDNNLQHIGYQTKELLESERLYAERNNHGGLQRYYAVTASTLDEALDANGVLSATLDSLHRAGELTSYTPAVSMLFQSQAEQERRIAAWHRYWTPAKVQEAMTAVRSAAAKNGIATDIFAPFQAMLEADYEPGDLYGSGIVPDGLLCNFIEESDGNYLIFNSVEMNPEKKQVMDDRIAAMPHAVVVDPFYYTGNMVSQIHSDFNTTLLISSIFVFLVLLVCFKDVVIALIAFLPMFLSWYVVQGWMAIFGLPFNLINIVISTFVFGIGVDYSIFVMQGLLSEVRSNDNRLLEDHKVAIFFSAFVLLVAVVTMLFARHPAIPSIGVTTLIGMVSTITITYTLQPLFFRLAMKWPFLKKRMM